MNLTSQQKLILKGKICPYCGNATASRKTQYGLQYYCIGGCDAYVGTHSDGRPLGRLADKELRGWKVKAHAFFDKIWKEEHMNRNQAYKWLSEQLEIPEEFTHIGMFGIKTCKKVIIFSGMYLEQLKIKQ